ncbi:MAG: ABC-type metal ion transport system, periplasmic component/surface adhesin [Verrucomicrobiales bacterium]|nr:ABC-type metal ion transport system, periplasmic component/surface adhesin [Verrucomicrobiales bacterium]
MRPFLSILVLFALCFPVRAELNVVTSVLPVYCLVKNVCGDAAHVENLIKPGIGPHDYQFSPSDLKKLASADLIFINGLSLEGWIEKPLRSAAAKALVSKVSDGLEVDLIRSVPQLVADEKTSPSADQLPNPHIWLDPTLWQKAAINVVRILSEKDPAHAELYRKNGTQYIETLKALDVDAVSKLKPFVNAPIITFHDAFPYFTRHYQLKLVGVVEQAPDVDPSFKHLHSLETIIKQEKVQVLLTEPQYQSRLVKSLSSNFKVPTAELDPMETGPLQADTYEKVMRKNIQTLVQVLKK